MTLLDLRQVAIAEAAAYSECMSVRRLATSFRDFLNHPGRVLVICIVFFATTLVLNGLLWRLWGLHRDFEKLTFEIRDSRSTIEKLGNQLKQAKDPSFIERQARDKLDLASDKDLVFVFPDQ